MRPTHKGSEHPESENARGQASSPSDPLIEVRGLRIENAGRALLDVPELEIRRGETLALIGPNGAGKSTLVRVLGMLQQPTSGSVTFDNRTVFNPSPAVDQVSVRRETAVVFQEPLLMDNTVFNNVALGLRLRGVSGPELKQRVDTWLDRFGITGLADRQARTLSGGEAQRTSLARAFVLSPQLLLLDEPFAGIDPATRTAVQTDVQRAMLDAATTTVLVTHDRDEALLFGDRVAVLVGGRLAQIGPPEEVFSRPADAQVAEIVGVENVFPGVVGSSIEGMTTIKTTEFEVEAVGSMAAGQSVLACIRPDDVTLTPAQTLASSARNRIAGVIDNIRPRGAVAEVTVRVGSSRLIALVTRASLGELGIAPGQPVVGQFKATAVHVISQGSKAP